MTTSNSKSYFEKLIDSYGVFAHNFTGADMYLLKEGYPSAVSYSLSNSFEIGRFGFTTQVTVYLPDNKVTVLLIADDSVTGKRVEPYLTVEVPNALEKGFMEKELKRAMKILVPEMTEQDFKSLPFSKKYFNLREVTKRIDSIAVKRGYISFQVNNYKKSETANFRLAVGAPTGRVSSSITATLFAPDEVDAIYTQGVIAKLPYRTLAKPTALVSILKDFEKVIIEPRLPELFA